MQVPDKTCSYPEKYILSEIMTSNQKKALYLQNPAIQADYHDNYMQNIVF